MRILRERLRACRPGYQFIFNGEMTTIELVDGSKLAATEASHAVRQEIIFLRESLGVLENTARLSVDPTK